MASITIQNLDEEIERKLQARAAENNRSIEEETCLILRHVLVEDPLPEKGLGTAIHKLFEIAGGIELDIPPRQSMREPPRFD